MGGCMSGIQRVFDLGTSWTGRLLAKGHENAFQAGGNKQLQLQALRQPTPVKLSATAWSLVEAECLARFFMPQAARTDPHLFEAFAPLH